MATPTTDWTNELSRRLSSLGLPPPRERAVIEELSHHLDEDVRDRVARGADPADAIRATLASLEAPGEFERRFAGILPRSPFALPPPGAPARGRWLHACWLDVRHSLRQLRRAPVLSLTVIATMALAIGPTTAMLSIGNWLLWRPVPAVSDSDQLAVVWFGRWRDEGGVNPYRVSPMNLADLASTSKTIQALAGTQESTASVTVEGQFAENMWVAHTDANLFDVLGLRPSAGRFFTADEDRLPYGALVAVVSHGFARRVFGTPDAAVGKAILVNSIRLEIVGVAPAGFRGIEPLSAVDIWYPGAAYRRLQHFSKIPPPSRGDGTFYSFIARLHPGTTFDMAQAELDVLAPNLAERYPDENTAFKTVRTRVFPGLGPEPLSRGRYQTIVDRLLLIGAVLVLLGCANVANLLIFRGVRREREHAVRLALGAGRARLLQLQLTESCLLTMGGATLGIALAVALTRVIVTLMLPDAVGSGIDLSVPIDGRVLLATLALAMAAGLAAGLFPAWIAVRRPIGAGLSQAGLRGTPKGRALRTGFASLQIALSLALLVAALLMVETVRGLRSVELGFEPAGVSVHRVGLRNHGYTPARTVQYLRDLSAAMAPANGVSAVGFSYSYPLFSAFRQTVHLPDPAAGNEVAVWANGTALDYFNVLDIPLLEGRTFTVDEALSAGESSENVAVISLSLATRLFGGASPVGRSLVVGSGKSGKPAVVVGVVGDVRADLAESGPELTLYQPLGREVLFLLSSPAILVESALPTADVSNVLRAAAARVDGSVPVYGHRPLQAEIDRRLADQRVFAWVLSLLGALGFVLAAVGLYGLLAQSVAERTREFGIRIAIGAPQAHVIGLVVRQAAIVAALGLAAGLTLAFFGVRLIDSQLWGVTGRDLSTYAAAAAALTAVVFAAALFPARTATRTDPVGALRAE